MAEASRPLTVPAIPLFFNRLADTATSVLPRHGDRAVSAGSDAKFDWNLPALRSVARLAELDAKAISADEARLALAGRPVGEGTDAGGF
jgi:hypothetical protein